jgi:Uma2 family endonuclease
MNIQSKHPTTADEFLRWNEGREGKREFVRGRVVELMMINTTRNHMRIATKLVVALARKLDLSALDVGTADFGVKTPDGVRFPDILVDQPTDGSTGDDLSASRPLLVGEILSPSSYTRDFGEKLDDYRGIPSLIHYIILAQDEPRIWLWSRIANGEWAAPLLIAGMEQSVELAGLQVTIGLAEIYAGLFDQPT